MSRVSAEQLREDYIANQMTIAAMSKRHGMAPSAIHYALAKAGIPRRKPGRRMAVNGQVRSQILAMRKNRQSIVRIAETTGLSRNAIWNFLKAEGLPMFAFRRSA